MTIIVMSEVIFKEDLL